MEESLTNLTLEETLTLSSVFRGVSDVQTEMIDALKEKQNMKNETIALLKNNIQIVADINSQNKVIVEMLKTQLANCVEIEKLEKMLKDTKLAPESDEKNQEHKDHTNEIEGTSRSTTNTTKKLDTENKDN
ncbi:hypothetical protein CAEBREN_19449 [Caenorhabditis brenneri]|uniref:Uncharacterized protein n=1 Tax=Caenorhabditis brenneri TaxID=135651 RepID=G0MHP7_CAEBE|nr:hypothetical protein CAEBREN_19449 [Caenorhabditis brenneri]